MKSGADIITIGLMELALMCGCKISTEGEAFINKTYTQASEEDKRWIDESCTEVSKRRI
jgi:hypothetical protein